MADVEPKPCITNLVSSYGILPTLASWLSTLDLHHLSLTSRTHYSHIAASPTIFKVLTRQSLCDGRGLARRQAYDNFNRVPEAGMPRNSQHGFDDEEIEVRLYATECDEAGALPCVKCGINVCEECRTYPRARPAYPRRRPHQNALYVPWCIMFLCETCDDAAEEEVQGRRFLYEGCDCDVYARWVCRQCKVDEDKFLRDYLQRRTKSQHDWTEEEMEARWEGTFTKTGEDGAWLRAFWCTCGASVDEDTVSRCTLCKRRHMPDQEEELGFGNEQRVPFFDDNPHYPRWVSDSNGDYPNPYPPLGRVEWVQGVMRMVPLS